MKEQPKTVGFQLDSGHHRRLEERAQRYQMSPGQYAREIIIRALDSNEEGILEALNWLAEKSQGAATAEELSKFRGDVTHNYERNYQSSSGTRPGSKKEVMKLGC